MFNRRMTLRGFTIAELLVAVAITSLIVVLLGTAFTSLSKTATHANQSVDAFRDARAALQMMKRDLSSIVRAPNAAYFAVDARYDDSQNSSPTKNRQVYALIATKNSGPGDVCAVGYYCRWDATTHSYSLNRYFRDSNELMAQTTYFDNYNPRRNVPPWNILGNGVSNYMRSDRLYQPGDVDDLGSNKIKDETLASYVWNLQITAFKADGTTDLSDPLIIDPSNPSAKLPAAIEVSFSAISPGAAKPLSNMNATQKDWMDSSSPNHRLLTSGAYDFRTRITL